MLIQNNQNISYNINYCIACGARFENHEARFCACCGAPRTNGFSVLPQNKNKASPAANFFLALCKCLGYYLIYFGLTFLVELIAEFYLIHKSGTPLLNPQEAEKVALQLLSDNFCIISIISSFLIILTYALIFIIRKKNVSKELSLNYVPLKYIASLFLIGVCGYFIVSAFLIALYSLFPSLESFSASSQLSEFLSPSSFLTEFIAVGVLAPLLEEILYRSIIYKRLKGVLSKKLAVFIAALSFGAAHGNIEQFVYTFFMGIVLCCAYEKFDSLWAPFAVHCAFNTTDIILEYIPSELLYGGVFYVAMFALSVGAAIILCLFVFSDNTNSNKKGHYNA